MLPHKLTLAILAILMAYLYSSFRDSGTNESNKRIQLILEAWKKNISLPTKRFHRVTVGSNACIDLIVPGVTLLKSLKLSPDKDADVAVISSLEDLNTVFHHSFARGSAAERFISNEEVFKQILDAASGLSQSQWYIGGNAALIAQNIAELFPEVQVQLVGPIGPKTKSLLHEKIRVPAESIQDKDEVHLILEFLTGEQWGSSVCPVASRFITSHDQSNGLVKPLDLFFNTISMETPDLIVFSGLHMMDAQPWETINQRLEVLLPELEGVPPHIPVHLELASMANEFLVQSIVEQVFHKVNSIGLNEQELSFISAVSGGPYEGIIEETPPPIHKIVDIITWIMHSFAYSPETKPQSRLSRVHFHTLSYHIIAVLPSSWKNQQSSVAAGTRQAGKLACNSDTLEPSKMVLKMPLSFKLSSSDHLRSLDYDNPVISFYHEGFEFVVSPVLVCKQPLKTVGLGDSISATGLLYSEFIPRRFG